MKSQTLMPTLLYTKAFTFYLCVSRFIVIYTNEKHAIPKYPAFKTLVAFLKSEFTCFYVFATFLYHALKKHAPYKITLHTRR